MLQSGVSLDVRVQGSGNDLGQKMTERVLGWAGVREPSDTPLVLAQIVEMLNRGAREDEFLNWCRNCHGSTDLNFIDKRWAKLFFISVAQAIYAGQRRQQNVAVASTLPYWTLWRGSDCCAGHASLSRSTAKWDDPVWDFIYPPNGWMCGCSVTACSEREPEVLASRRRRVSTAMKGKCSSWLDRRPTWQLRFLR